MNWRPSATFLTALAMAAQANAVPIKGGDPLEVLTASDKSAIDPAAYCEAKIGGKTVYLTEAGGSGVIRYDNKRYILQYVDDTKFEYEAVTPGYPMSDEDSIPFGVEIHKIPGARTTQSGEESWTTPAKMVVYGTTGPAWGA